MGRKCSSSCVCVASLASFGLIVCCGVAGSLLSSSGVDATVTKGASINVGDSCTMVATGGGTYAKSMQAGITAEIPGSTINITCNDAGGFSLYTIGNSGDTLGSTDMIGTNASIATGTSGDSSYWAMKVNPTVGNTPTIENSFDSYHVVPSAYTLVTSRESATSSEGLSVSTTYKVSTTTTQAADDYTGQVKYTLVHPYDADPPVGPTTGINLYDAVASAWETEGSRVMTNDTDTNTGIQATITTSNSGVFKYNPSTFGTSSDASNDHDIYFYRGILDTTTGSYGSNGDNEAHPNTVVLSSAGNKSGLTTNDTCWRIVRTTGSGGVKMVYQGKWTGSTCANAQSNAQVTTSAFNGNSSTYQQIVRVGYTYNSTYATNTAQSGTIAQVFGTNSNPGANNTRSAIKEYIEDTWYANNMTSYTSKLESSAGYCNDRTMNTTTSWTTPLAESSTIAATYGTSGLQPYYFGAYPRNMNAAQPPSLTCAKYSNIDRSTVDLYRYVSGSNGTSNQLKYPVALLTADELSFAGSGRSTASLGSSYNSNSFLRSGSDFWLLSPYFRGSSGVAFEFSLVSRGVLLNYNVDGTYGVRPSISLTSGTTASSGSGTATDPWIVEPN